MAWITPTPIQVDPTIAWTLGFPSFAVGEKILVTLTGGEQAIRSGGLGVAARGSFTAALPHVSAGLDPVMMV